MKIKSYKISLLFKIIIFVIAIMSTVDTIVVRVPQLGGDGKPLGLFFTSWTAWVCTLSIIFSIIYTILVLCGKKQKVFTDACRTIKIMADAMAIVTFIIAAFVVPEKIWTADYWTYGWILKHFLLPIFMIADTIMFYDGSTKLFDVFLGGTPMLLYGAYMIPHVLIYRHKCGGHIPEAEWGNYYPYGFTNIDKNGGSVAIIFALILGLAVAMVGISLIYYFVDKRKNKQK